MGDISGRYHRRRQLFYAFDLPSTYAHTHAVHVEICWASDCFPWKHNTINKRNIFPKGKAQQEQQHLALTAADIPTPIYNWPEETTRSQTTGLCNKRTRVTDKGAFPNLSASHLLVLLQLTSLCAPRGSIIRRQWAPVDDN